VHRVEAAAGLKLGAAARDEAVRNAIGSRTRLESMTGRRASSVAMPEGCAVVRSM
jgi:hypothetical protein